MNLRDENQQTEWPDGATTGSIYPQSSTGRQIQQKKFASGIVTCWSKNCDLGQFFTALHDVAADGSFCAVFVFYSQAQFDESAIASAGNQFSGEITLVGCSSCGTLTPEGLEDDGCMVAVMLPTEHFTVASAVLRNVHSLGMNDIVTQVQALKESLAAKAGSRDFHDVFAVNLIDGLSYSEEAVTAALHTGLDSMPLVGGSAGDDLAFTSTSLFCDGESHNGSAVLTLVKSKLPFEIFTNNNFVPTEHKLVVTDSDPDKRVVREFNAEPAAIEYARIVGLDPNNLTPENFASHPVVVRVGGEYYCRAIQQREEDNSLSFFCAIDDGIVLTIAKPTGMINSTQQAIEQLRKKLGDLDMILGFDCILRRLDAQNRGNFNEVSALYKGANVVGFGTYGEQFNSMHINQTFTGVAFGLPSR